MNKMEDIWESKFSALAMFNAEKARGIMHTREYIERMRVMQDEYDKKLSAWQRKRRI
jgi:hypothetical protein